MGGGGPHRVSKQNLALQGSKAHLFGSKLSLGASIDNMRTMANSGSN